MPSPHPAKQNNPHGAKNHLRALDSHLQLDKFCSTIRFLWE